MAEVPPVVLTIAGFDPSSGAGVTADIKTIAAHGCYGVACITAMTVQSTAGSTQSAGASPVEPTAGPGSGAAAGKKSEAGRETRGAGPRAASARSSARGAGGSATDEGRSACTHRGNGSARATSDDRAD